MKKIFIFILFTIQLFSISALGYSSNTLEEDDLVQIYSIALNSFMPDSIVTDSIKYIAIDMNTKFFDNISQNGRKEILSNFKKYDKKIINESLDSLKEKGLADKFGNLLSDKNISGLLLSITTVNITRDNEIIIEGNYYESPIAGKGFVSTLKKIDGEWKLINTKLLYIS